MDNSLIANLSNFRVLYAEDEEGIRSNLLELFNMLFKEVYSAANGEEAYALYEEKKPDLVITDIKMPKMTGIELAKKIREDDAEVEIIIISAHTEVEYMLEAIELSLIKYIVKPVTETKLFEVFNKFLDKKTGRLEYSLGSGYTCDLKKSAVYHDGEETLLTKKEAKVLSMLLNTENVIRYEEIEREVWGDDEMTLNALRLLIKNLRKKLPSSFLTNIQGVGYKKNIV